MTLGERIKKVRKDKDFTQQQFAERLGMKRNSIAQVEGGRATSDQTIFAICREFNVNERWLRTGEGGVYVESEIFSLDQYAKERGATELDLAVAKVYFDLPPAIRTEMLEKLKRLMFSVNSTQRLAEPTIEPAASTSYESEARAEAEAYYQEILQEKKAAAESSASTAQNANSKLA